MAASAAASAAVDSSPFAYHQEGSIDHQLKQSPASPGCIFEQALATSSSSFPVASEEDHRSRGGNGEDAHVGVARREEEEEEAGQWAGRGQVGDCDGDSSGDYVGREVGAAVDSPVDYGAMDDGPVAKEQGGGIALSEMSLNKKLNASFYFGVLNKAKTIFFKCRILRKKNHL